jgi:hypothetical protein
VGGKSISSHILKAKRVLFLKAQNQNVIDDTYQMSFK